MRGMDIDSIVSQALGEKNAYIAIYTSREFHDIGSRIDDSSG